LPGDLNSMAHIASLHASAKRSRVPRSPLVGAVIVLSCVAAAYLAGMRINPRPPEKSFDLEDLFLPSSALPDPWSRSSNAPSDACESAPLGSGCQSFRALYLAYPYLKVPGGGASQETHQYYSSADAIRDYLRLEQGWFSYNPTFGTQWSVPVGLSFSSASASEFRLGCHFHGSDESCQLVAQYDEFIVRFVIRRSVGIGNGRIDLISYEDSSQLFASLDSHVASLLDGETTQRLMVPFTAQERSRCPAI